MTDILYGWRVLGGIKLVVYWFVFFKKKPPDVSMYGTWAYLILEYDVILWLQLLVIYGMIVGLSYDYHPIADDFLRISFHIRLVYVIVGPRSDSASSL